MESIQKQSLIVAHLMPDEKILESLISLGKKHNIQTGVVLSGIGQVKQVTLGYFKEKGDYTPQKFNETYELLSLTGTLITQDDTIHPHLHAIIGSEKKSTHGGHLIDATVEVTGEIIIQTIPLNLHRKKSLKTGLMELSLNNI